MSTTPDQTSNDDAADQTPLDKALDNAYFNIPDTKAAIQSLIADCVPAEKPKWDVGEYQVIEDALSNQAQQLYEDIRTGFNECRTAMLDNLRKKGLIE